MRVVAYTRTTSCWKGDVPAADIISQQNERIKEFATAHGWQISEKYSDRKKNNDENSAFQTLLQDGLYRKFDLVIVDSVYRAGKDLWNAKEVLLQTFHYAGIGFAIVEDDFCSIGKSNEEADRYFDEKYGKLRRETIRYNVNKRNRAGVLSWSDEKYGYKLSEDNMLIIDENTAPVVKRIFDLSASGMKPQKIAEILSAEQIPSPLVMRGMNVEIKDPYKWTRLSVRRLLDKTVYIGHWVKTVQGEEIAMTNEPIVSREVFDKVQELIQENTRETKTPVRKYMYAGVVCDPLKGCCLRCRTSKKGERYIAYAEAQKGELHGRKLPMEELDEALYRALKEEQKKARWISSCLSTDCGEKRNEMLARLNEAYIIHAFMVSDLGQERMEKYRLFLNGKITAEEMEQCETNYQTEIKNKEGAFESLNEKREHIRKAFSEKNIWLQLFLSWDGEMPTTNAMLKKYISKIEIEDLRNITIIPNHVEWYMDFPKEWSGGYGTKE